MLEGKVLWFFVCLAWCLGQLYLEGTFEPQPGDRGRTASTVTEVQFRHAGECPLILLPVHVNEKGPYEFILDTGAAQTVLAAEIARELGIASTGAREGMGAGGKLTIQLGTVESLAIGSAYREELSVGITDELERIASALGTKIAGVIGYDFLKNFRVTIDYTGQQLRLEQGTLSPSSGVAVEFQMAPRKPLLIVPAEVNGHGPFQFVLDTGASASAISPELAARLEITSAPGQTEGLGAGGSVSLSLAKLESLRVGQAPSHGLTVIVPEMLAPLGEAVGTRLDGIAGYDYLRNFRLTIDYPQGRLILEPLGSR